MQLSTARKILGLGPDDDPRPHLVEFQSARERIAEMVRSAPNETLGDRYQQGLVEFDQALAAVQEYLEALGLAQPPEPSGQRKEAEEPPEEPAEPAFEDDIETEPDGRPAVWIAWALVILIGVLGGGYFYYKVEESRLLQRKVRITLLERVGAEYIENRRWQEAAESFSEIESLEPGSKLAVLGRRSIEAGMAEEQTQFVGYWTGQAIAELESGRLDEAEAAVNQVITRFPGEKETVGILERIAAARKNQAHDANIAGANALLEQENWDAAISAATRILKDVPDDEAAKSIIEEAETALARITVNNAKALDLLAMAIPRDQGEFDQQALDWLREAASLSPHNEEIAAQLEKMSSYTRTIRVPEDYPTPTDALAIARDRDRIVLGEQTWMGPLVVNVAVELQGAGADKSVIECSADEGSAISIGPDAKGARISGITFRHASFVAVGTDRFSAALVRGGGATFMDCHFNDASGHGLAIIENGEAVVNRCRFTDNGWNGAAAIGMGSLLEMRECVALGNFEHGIESWDGAAVILINNRCEGNSRNGIHADNGLSSATIEGNQLIANREFGLVLGSAANGKVANNTARSNLLGGIVIRTPAANLPVKGNQITQNEGPGLVLEKGLSASSYAENTVTRNKSNQILADADLSPQEPDDGKHEAAAGNKPPR